MTEASEELKRTGMTLRIDVRWSMQGSETDWKSCAEDGRMEERGSGTKDQTGWLKKQLSISPAKVSLIDT